MRQLGSSPADCSCAGGGATRSRHRPPIYKEVEDMSGVAQAGLFFFLLFVAMFPSAGSKSRGPRIRDEDAETWWYARQSWWNDRR